VDPSRRTESPASPGISLFRVYAFNRPRAVANPAPVA
jgi:hypothetical protein